MLVALLVGLAVGCVNGFLVSRINVPPFIATLGTLTAGSGLAYVIGGGAPRVCPPGTHPGYLRRFCWPNR